MQNLKSHVLFLPFPAALAPDGADGADTEEDATLALIHGIVSENFGDRDHKEVEALMKAPNKTTNPIS